MRIVILIVVVLLVLAAAALAAVGWVFSTRILVPAPYQLFPEFELGATERHEDGSYRVRLPLPGTLPRQHARTDVQGRYGLLWQGGAGMLGPVLARDADDVTRRVEPTRGEPPVADLPARMDTVLWTGPAERGVAYDEVRIPGPLGELPGWWVSGRPEDAVLVLHGRRRADRSEALRILPTLVAEGASVLVASYRNHDASPASPDGFYHYGQSEVDDALAALAWLRRRGARRVVVMGFSMGGSVAIGAVLRAPSDGPEPVGLILDAPLIDPTSVFALGATRMGLPAPRALAAWATRVAGWRAGIDFAALDRRRSAPSLELPVLLFAGTADTTIPVATVDAFAARLPDLRAYHRLDAVEHVEAWNADPEAYERAVRNFLTVVFDPTAVATAR